LKTGISRHWIQRFFNKAVANSANEASADRSMPHWMCPSQSKLISWTSKFNPGKILENLQVTIHSPDAAATQPLHAS
jgi:hypothetical protein